MLLSLRSTVLVIRVSELKESLTSEKSILTGGVNVVVTSSDDRSETVAVAEEVAVGAGDVTVTVDEAADAVTPADTVGAGDVTVIVAAVAEAVELTVTVGAGEVRVIAGTDAEPVTLTVAVGAGELTVIAGMDAEAVALVPATVVVWVVARPIALTPIADAPIAPTFSITVACASTSAEIGASENALKPNTIR